VLSNEWTFEVDGERMSSVTAEVARRQPDGWLLRRRSSVRTAQNRKNWAAIAAAMDLTVR